MENVLAINCYKKNIISRVVVRWSTVRYNWKETASLLNFYKLPNVVFPIIKIQRKLALFIFSLVTYLFYLCTSLATVLHFRESYRGYFRGNGHLLFSPLSDTNCRAPNESRTIPSIKNSVLDPLHFGTEPDADPDPRKTQIRTSV